MKANFLYTLILVALVPFSTQCSTDRQEYNILLIISDDLRNELKCYGSEHIHSPNIDKLAGEGFLFERAYVQQAVCAASRASFLTGARPNTTGVDYPYSQYFVEEFLPEHHTISSYFFNKGYYTRNFGKIHHGKDLDTLSEPHFVPRKSEQWPSAKYALPANIEIEKTRGRKHCPPVEAADVNDTIYQDGKITHAVIQALRKASELEQPFCFSVGYFKPHLPFNAPKKYWDLYAREDIKLAVNKELPAGAPEYATAHYSLKGYASESSDPGRVISDSTALTLKHAYYACVSFIDHQVGELVSELEKLEMKKNTIIVFLSDHGWHLGEQGMWGKTTNFENATRAPLIISIPGSKNKSVKSTALVEYVDIFPTLIDATGYTDDMPVYFEGSSLMPLIQNPKLEWKTAAFSQFPRGYLAEREGYSVRTNNFRYTEWWDNEEDSLLYVELYDHKNDPAESVNMAMDPKYIDILKKHSETIKTGWKGALPEGMINKSNNQAAPRAVAYGPEGAERRRIWEEYQLKMKSSGEEPKVFIGRY